MYICCYLSSNLKQGRAGKLAFFIALFRVKVYMSLIGAAEKSFYENIISQVAQTFERNIVAHLEAEKVIISTNPSFSRFGTDNSSIQNVPVYYTIPARIQYQTNQKTEFVDVLQGGSRDEAQLKINQTFGQVRIKIPESGNAIFSKAKQIEIDGSLYNVVTTARGHGLFSSNYYTYYLELSQ